MSWMTRRSTALWSTAALVVTLPFAARAQETVEEDPNIAVETTPQVQAEIIPIDQWSAEWSPEKMRALEFEVISVESILNSDVYGVDGADMGDVDNVLFDMEGRVVSVIAEFGGFVEIGDTHVNIPWDMVSVEDWTDGVVLPFGQDEVDNYSLFFNEAVTADAAASKVQEASGDGAGQVQTGAQTWRATDLIGDYARLRRDNEILNYGYVDDIIVRRGEIVAVLVTPDVAWDDARGGNYAYPYYGPGYGWEPGAATYDLPYTRDEAGQLRPYQGPAVPEGLFEE